MEAFINQELKHAIFIVCLCVHYLSNHKHFHDKKVKNKGRVRHLPDSRLKTSLQQKVPSEKNKYKELSPSTMAFIRCRLTGISPLQ